MDIHLPLGSTIALARVLNLSIDRPRHLKPRSYVQVDRPKLLPVSDRLMEAETGFLRKISREAIALEFIAQPEPESVVFCQ